MLTIFYRTIAFKLITVIIILFSAINIAIVYLNVPGPLQEQKAVIIPRGCSQRQIAKILVSEEVIRHPQIFIAFLKAYGLKNQFKSGEYMFTPKTSPRQVIKTLIHGKSIIHKLLIPEGFTVKEIIDVINSKNVLEGEVLGPIPEGYLLPNTYFYSFGDQRQTLIEKMRNNMSEALDRYMPLLQTDSPLKTRLDVLILASIIEREAMLNSEKPIIASVYLNRLRKGMKLQADPTTIYAITMGERRLDRPLTYSDLKVDSPYNTYVSEGLPPSAISCPGEKSISAVVSPAKTNYLYFVANGIGGHYFSTNYQEHELNVQKYRRFQQNKK